MARRGTVTILILLLTGCAQDGPFESPLPTPGPAHYALLPLTAASGIQGPGLAGCAPENTLLALGARWCYNWSPNCHGNRRCVPMFRPGATAAGVPAALATCGRPCRAALLMNEPDLAGQDNLSLSQQVAFVHDIGQAIRTHDPAVQIVVGGLWTPLHTDWPASFVALYRATYPGEDLPVDGIHVHQYVLACDTHDLQALSGCADGTVYPPDAATWQRDLETFVAAAQAAFGPVPVLLTEWGCLYDEPCWQRVVVQQANYLWGHGPFPGPVAGDAVFLYGDGAGYCCSLGRGSQPSDLGMWYAGVAK